MAETAFIITEIDDKTGEFAASIDAMLDEAALKLGLPFEPDKLNLKVTDPEDRLIGGLSGYVTQGWLYVKLLAVIEEMRGSGLGRQLLGRAEEFARDKQLAGVYLDTFNFQAPGFYQKLGYVECGRLPASGNRAQRVWYAKTFDVA